jgi:UDP-3-O-[3-hydroxymyristoyl] N-acetylglucosamine deacetylase/3-hydroxyacyl-[acyl-carrier-protein] dehydratase
MNKELMTDRQKTIANEVSLTGVGLHTGINVTMTFKPAPEDHGYKFKRVDLDKQPIIPALAENVVDTARGTTIAKGEARVSTIEHVLAAAYSLEIDNLLIEIDGPETPIMDGSSIRFFEVLQKAGIKEQDLDREYFVVRENVRYVNEEKGIEIIAYPDHKYSVDVLIDFNSKVLGHQYASLTDLSEFGTQIAPCRTFAFFHELEPLFKNNLIKGGALENAIVIVENEYPQEEFDRIADLFNKPHLKAKRGILNNVNLHFSNEPARHKLLDVIGDLALAGRRIKGKIIAKRPGHLANTEFANKIRQIVKFEQKNGVAPRYYPDEPPVRDINDIMKVLPHRPPFLLVDKIIHMDETTVVGVKCVTMNEPFFVGHFPQEPVMPGVLQIEAMAQVGGLLALNDVEDPKEWSTYFLKIDNVRFKQKVVPGDTLIFRLDLISPIRRGIAHMRGQVFVGTSLVMDAELMAQLVRNKVTAEN